ncbi:CRISPR-associated protein Cas4 [Halothiobacillus neapolitanus]|uniref:CRISPR-associated exonuclease Cas4 n=1 Tax=Halothiobacillus neapolitanus (strain ATCC 23641 / DSM 15147 / CIP 104769 / NCIMB 8539 / c2) TaxID=555778 RepID=D0KYZ5_HALNC|nr:CRISPR-associated protein Cas4 [Halothiobacillus neapolitanus]ACX95668.1 CRISPR-associated protein Cas4 [Halothiobacillus neapolitanus c2]TDN65973.1 CRISPR-associated Cas4 family exonuclease [Halothiobacillus neapolitanus]
MNEPDSVPLSALQHWVYCPRQCGLIHLEQAFEDNIHTARGQAVHHLVDTPGYEIKSGVRVERALPLWSDQYNLIGKADLVEFHPDGSIYPVEFKHGAKRQKLHDDIQLAAQAICLEDMLGRPVPKAAIFHASSHRRREVAITQALRDLVLATAEDIRAMLASSKLPPPVNDARCKECSLKEICQPEALAEQMRLHRLREELFNVAQ